MRRILVVEDSRNCVELLEVALQPAELRVTGSAEEALELLKKERFELVVTDVNLPGMDGLELTSELRRNGREPHLPIIVLSGNPNPEIPLQALERGADAFFAKPYSPAALRRKAEELARAR